MYKQTTVVNEPASGSDAGKNQHPCRGTRRLARKLLARRVTWRRRVVGSMLAGLAVVAAAQLALDQYGVAAAPGDRGIACATLAMQTAASGKVACLPAFASAPIRIAPGELR